VHRDAGGFAERHQARHDMVGIAVFLDHRLAVKVRGDAAHVVVHGRNDWHRLAGQVDAGKDARGFGDARQPLCQNLRVEMVEVQEDVIFLRTDTAALADLDGHGAGNHVT
jgi:hypothetical protein